MSSPGSTDVGEPWVRNRKNLKFRSAEGQPSPQQQHRVAPSQIAQRRRNPGALVLGTPKSAASAKGLRKCICFCRYDLRSSIQPAAARKGFVCALPGVPRAWRSHDLRSPDSLHPGLFSAENCAGDMIAFSPGLTGEREAPVNLLAATLSFANLGLSKTFVFETYRV
jgi:hypothetical protein